MLKGRRGSDTGWIQTYSGKRFWPLDPDPRDICVEDIAHSLSQICRFGGHCTQFYSVAEHSWRVYDLVRLKSQQQLTLDVWALLHDAPEAYLVDMPRPVKHYMPYLEKMEGKIMRAIMAHCDVPTRITPKMKAKIQEADDILLATERRDLMAKCCRKWPKLDVEPLDEEIIPYPQWEVKRMFLRRWYMQRSFIQSKWRSCFER